jgi:hypothetical protein
MMIRKLICWRNADGKPDQIEAQWKAAAQIGGTL